MKISFFSTPSHRVFNYEPLYYNEQKEKIKELYKKYGKQYPDQANGDKKAEEELSKESDKEQEQVKNKKFDAIEAFENRQYIPGKSIMGSFRESLEKNRKQAGNKKIKKVIVLLTLIAALFAAYYLAQGLSILFRQP